MDQICGNCLNAYNSPHDADVHCANREWLQQFHPEVCTVVARRETCGTWQRRNVQQKPLVFGQAVQLNMYQQ